MRVKSLRNTEPKNTGEKGKTLTCGSHEGSGGRERERRGGKRELRQIHSVQISGEPQVSKNVHHFGSQLGTRERPAVLTSTAISNLFVRGHIDMVSSVYSLIEKKHVVHWKHMSVVHTSLKSKPHQETTWGQTLIHISFSIFFFYETNSKFPRPSVFTVLINTQTSAFQLHLELVSCQSNKLQQKPLATGCTKYCGFGSWRGERRRW